MKSTTYYLDQIAKLTETGSDYAVAKLLGISGSRICNYRNGRAHFDDMICLKVANILQIELTEVIASANYQREKDKNKKAFWLKAFNNVKKPVAASLIMGLSFIDTLTNQAHAAHEMVRCILCQIRPIQNNAVSH